MKEPKGPEGAFAPECDKSGAYLKIQCHEGYCWCVDKNGNELKDSRTEFGNPICEKGNLVSEYVNFTF